MVHDSNSVCSKFVYECLYAIINRLRVDNEAFTLTSHPAFDSRNQREKGRVSKAETHTVTRTVLCTGTRTAATVVCTDGDTAQPIVPFFYTFYLRHLIGFALTMTGTHRYHSPLYSGLAQPVVVVGRLERVWAMMMRPAKGSLLILCNV